ncbi:hypothetical protein PV04_02775 [Phialophora macrospora]|uniref:HypA-like protein n=1 Tax=Phialophora macrospora TaxID=1851006 RepID=A0A0D2FQG3_9EURO|nr:hypothetical protein PV04_02775 [Phialophora macrospora]
MDPSILPEEQEQEQEETRATATTIHLTPSSPAIIHVPTISPSSADKTTSLLQHNHESHHITFDEIGRHNHIVHHLLASFSLGADAETLQNQYDRNAEYQRPPPPLDESIITQLHDPESFQAQMENPDNYSNFLAFFIRQLSTSSLPAVLNEYVFSDNPLAHALFNRFFSGYYHPFIHLGYGLEFAQPAIVAEALAQACVHSSYLDDFFTATAKAARSADRKTLVHLLQVIHDDQILLDAVKWEDGQKVRDGILARAPDTMIQYASQFRVLAPYTESVLDEYAAEVIDAAVYFTAAAQHPRYVVKMDFFYMHAVTSSVFLSVFLRQRWLAPAAKARLIEWKGRLDLALYASRGSPRLLIDEIGAYPADGKGGQSELRPWEDMYREAAACMDDGHTVKFIRALKNGEQACGPFENENHVSTADRNGNINGVEDPQTPNSVKDGERWKIKAGMWRRVAMMVLDSVKPEYGDRWARNVGFEQAWKKYPLRAENGRVAS